MRLDDFKDLADLSIRVAQDSGADYAEARIHGTKRREFLLKNGDPQPSVLAEGLGIGIRVIYRNALGFSATNLLDKRSVRQLSLKAVRMARASGLITKRGLRLDDSKPVRKKWAAEERDRIEGADASWLKSLLLEIDSRIRDERAGIKIPNRLLTASASVEEKYLVNTDGARVESRVPRLSFTNFLAAVHDGETAQRSVHEAGSGGLEVAKRLHIIGRIEEEAKMLGRVIRRATKPPVGITDVVLSPELSGIAAHESVGHPQEADRILGREGAQAGESYLRRNSLGMRIGSREANVSDDPGLVRSYGYTPVDDEGIEGKKRRLIKNGLINEFLQNRSTAAELKTRSNGASRSVGYNREPIIRMSNTFVEPGDYTFDELLKEVKEGVYIKSFTEWNIDDKRLNQRYVGLEAYYVDHGELKNFVKAPVLEITTPKLWSSVKARSKRLEFSAGICGKGDPMQGVPCWLGGPETLLTGIKLGSG